jgi:hypothetical protein
VAEDSSGGWVCRDMGRLKGRGRAGAEAEQRPGSIHASSRAYILLAGLAAPTAGIVENMSWFVCGNCGHESHPFGSGEPGRQAGEGDGTWLTLNGACALEVGRHKLCGST